MKRRRFLTAALLAPLAPKLAQLPVMPEPVKALVLGPEKLELVKVPAVNFGTLTPAQMRYWSRELFLEAYRVPLLPAAPEPPLRKALRKLVASRRPLPLVPLPKPNGTA